jgi:hypothetical protein
MFPRKIDRLDDACPIKAFVDVIGGSLETGDSILFALKTDAFC